MAQFNPFLIEGYRSAEYFCDRVDDTQLLHEHISNQRNVALISPRRLGKSGLIHNFFFQDEVRKHYHTFYIDIYDTKNLTEFTYAFGKCVFEMLKSTGRQAWETFVNVLKSLKLGVTFDINGMPEWGISVGDIHSPDVLLDEIFSYLEHAEKPCIVAFDEFQVIAGYPEKTVEATLRKRIQNCKNVHFIYAGSKRHMMAEMFASHARPFYNSSALMGLGAIDEAKYLEFANRHLSKNQQRISADAFHFLYQWTEGVTWHIQVILNGLYARKDTERDFTQSDVLQEISNILQRNTFAYKALLFQLPPKQKQVLYAIAKEGKANKITSQAFLRKHALTASTVQGAVKVLLERDFITLDEGIYQVNDRFFELFLNDGVITP
ncbi:MAG: ATPase [Bacteroidales bacterium]|nr:ATPase [Bacteroidales bacterium]